MVLCSFISAIAVKLLFCWGNAFCRKVRINLFKIRIADKSEAGQPAVE